MSTPNTNTNTNFNVFDSFSEYQVKILFQGWLTVTVWQFAASCVGLFAFSIVFHLLRWLKVRLERVIADTINKLSDKYVSEEAQHLVGQGVVVNRTSARERELIGLYVALWVLSTIQTTLWLLLSMANMTFNPWVFISIVMGYSVGEVAVHGKIAHLRRTS
jgi:hypothetical protein